MGVDMNSIPTEFLRLDENGNVFIELVARQAKGKIKSMIHYSLDNFTPEQKAEIAKMASQKGSAAIAGAFSAGTGEAAAAATAGALLPCFAAVAAIAAVGIGVTVAEFAKMNKKLEQMSIDLGDMNSLLKAMDALVKQQVIQKPYLDIISDTKEILFAFENEEEVPKDKLKNILREYRKLMLTLYEVRNTYANEPENYEKFMNLYFELAPLFSNMIVLYYQTYADELYGKLDPLHSEWMQVFEESGSQEFLDELQDFYYIDKRMHNAVVNEIVQNQMTLNELMTDQINMSVAIASVCRSAEEFKAMKERIETEALEQAKNEYRAVLTELYPEEKAESMISFATAQMMAAV